MSERAIADPSQHGWVEVDGKWKWDVSGGSSIQDGDTEGQITTWDGTEWTPEGAVVVAGESLLVGTDNDNPTAPSQNAEGISMSSAFGVRSSVKGNTLTLNRIDDYGDVALFRKDGERGGAISIGNGHLGLRGPSASDNDAITIDADGNVGIGEGNPSSKLHVDNGGSGDLLNLTGQLGSITSNKYGNALSFSRPDSNYISATGSGANLQISAATFLRLETNGTERMRIDADGNVNITGKLFINGQEVGAGGGGDSLWTDNADGTISSTKTAKAPDFIAG